MFLLSPANAGGQRAQMVLNERAEFEVARKLRLGTATFGEVFTFVSGLYFRGKMAYSRAFAVPPSGIPGSFIITPGFGLVPPDTPVTLEDLRRAASVRIDGPNPDFLEPLNRDARQLSASLGPDCHIVLLGSIATSKYVEPLLEVFGDRLVFPPDFVGRGDMSRGGLMLRAADAGQELAYTAVAGAVRHGKRPPRLPKLLRSKNSTPGE